MKKNNIKKRLAALRSGLMLSLFVICPFSVYKADNEATPTTYGSYSTNQYYNGNVGPTGSSTFKPVTVFAYSFNGTYNGRFTIYWKYWRSGTAQTNTLQAIELMLPINCYVESISDSSCTIAFKNQSEIAIILQSVAINDEIEITGVSNYNMTKITDGVASQLDHLNNMIDQLFVNSGTIITRFNTLNQTTADILNAIQDYFTDNNGTTINIGDIILQFNEFNAQLQLQLGILNDLKTALDNIDSKIDSISWNNITFKGITQDFSTFTSSYTQQVLNNSTYVAFNQTNEFAGGQANVKLFKLTLPAYASNNDFHVYFNNNSNTKYEVNIIFYQKTRGTLNVYFTLENSNVWGNLYPTIQWNGATIYTSPTPTLQFIDNNDIEYWSLYNDFLNYNFRSTLLNQISNLTPIDYNSKLDDIIDAINDLEINYNISNDIETEINNTLENINDIDVVINNNVDVFNNNKNTILTNMNTLEEQRLTRMNNTINFLYNHIFVNQFRNIYGTYLWYMLFGVLIIMILG